MKKHISALLLSGVLCLGLCAPASAENGHWDFSNPDLGPQWVSDEMPGSPETPSTSVPGSPNSWIFSVPDSSKAFVRTSTTNQGITVTTAVPTASVQDGWASASIDALLGSEIVAQAVSNGSDAVVIAPAIAGNASQVQVSIPTSVVEQIGSQTSASLTVSTPVASVTIPNGGLYALSRPSGTVTVTVKRTGHIVDLSIAVNAANVERIPGGITLAVPEENTAPGTVAVLVHGDGSRETIRKSAVRSGSVIIPLDGPARLELVDNSKSFADVPSQGWIAEAVAFVSAHELLTGTAPSQFSPSIPMSRGMLAVVLHNLENNPVQPFTGDFADVSAGDWYAGGVTWAAASGIAGGYGDGRFGPDDSITREQLAVMLWRYAGRPVSHGLTLNFADADQASDWAVDALRWAVDLGILQGRDSGILDPGGYATRAEAAQMLKNYMER